jgi:putative toxin-antitoxin system antitoxin component (TIGR02293 family)
VRGAGRKRLPPDVSERLFAVASVYALAIAVFGDTQTAFGWINEPQFGLAGRTPFTLISSELGRREVSSLLQRIEHGLLA